MRPAGPSRRGRARGLPVLAQGVSVHASVLRPRGVPGRLAMATHWVLPSSIGILSAPRRIGFRGSIALPTPTPVNASPPPSRRAAHDSGPTRMASPSSYDSLIRTTLPVYPGAPLQPVCRLVTASHRGRRGNRRPVVLETGRLEGLCRRGSSDSLRTPTSPTSRPPAQKPFDGNTTGG